jgi:hypothetical protein
VSEGSASVAFMTNASPSLESLSSGDLLSATRQLVRKSHCLEADLLLHLGEIDERKLYAECARPSMFAFCVDELGFSDDAAYNRITVARAGRRLPAVIEAARSGRVHLAGLRRLAPHLTRENHEAVLAEAAGKSKRDIELLVARLAPLPPVPATIRKLPECPVIASSLLLRSQSPIGVPGKAPVGSQSQPPLVSPELRAAAYAPPEEPYWQIGPEGSVKVPPESVQPPADFRLRATAPDSRRPSVTPLTEETFKVQFTAGRALRDKLQEAQDLLRHRLPDGDMASIFEHGLDLLIAQVKKERFGVGRKPRAPSGQRTESAKEDPTGDAEAGGGDEAFVPQTAPSASRHIPDAVKRAVYERDGGRCAFVDERGQRCTATAFLEFDHVEGFALTHLHDADLIRLLCRAHNQYVADLLYGRAFMDRARGGSDASELVPGRVEVASPEGVRGEQLELVPGRVEPSPIAESHAMSESSQPTPGQTDAVAAPHPPPAVFVDPGAEMVDSGAIRPGTS